MSDTVKLHCGGCGGEMEWPRTHYGGGDYQKKWMLDIFDRWNVIHAPCLEAPVAQNSSEQLPDCPLCDDRLARDADGNLFCSACGADGAAVSAASPIRDPEKATCFQHDLHVNLAAECTCGWKVVPAVDLPKNPRPFGKGA